MMARTIGISAIVILLATDVLAEGTLSFRSGPSVNFVRLATTQGEIEYHIQGQLNNASVRYAFAQLREIQFFDNHPHGRVRIVATNGNSVVVEKSNVLVRERNGGWRNDNRIIYRHVDPLTGHEAGGVVGSAQRDLSGITFR